MDLKKIMKTSYEMMVSLFKSKIGIVRGGKYSAQPVLLSAKLLVCPIDLRIQRR